MKEIKFRVYDKNSLTNKISYGKMEWFDDMIGFRFDHFDNEPEDLIVMQYTGLKDRNGKEIYEGDIIECWSEGIKAQGEIARRIDGLWIIYPAYQKKIMWGLCPNRNGKAKVEIIGNIYDNPELLKGQESKDG